MAKNMPDNGEIFIYKPVSSNREKNVMRCRSTRSNVCKVAIVDDDPFDLDRIRDALNDLNGPMRQGGN